MDKLRDGANEGILNIDSRHGYLGIEPDQTERMQREATVASREQQLISTLHTMAEGLVIHDREGRLIEANAAAEELLMLSRQQLFNWDVARPHWQAIDENGLPLQPEDLPVIRTLRTGAPVRGQIVGIRIADQPVRWISINAQPLYNGDDSTPSGVVGTFSDITALRDSVERIRELAQRVEVAREQERRELALALHEGLAQDLFSARLALSNLQREWPDPHTQKLEELSQILDRCLVETRQVATSLRPSGPIDQPISHVIGRHAQYFAGLSNLRINMHESDMPHVTDEQTRLLLFRAAQESLANVARHAHATRIEIFLERIGSKVELRIEDDGAGLQPGALDKPGSLGLLGIRERARAIGGTLSIERSATGGTTFALRLPIGAQQQCPLPAHFDELVASTRF